MGDVQLTVNVPKELDDYVQALKNLVLAVKAGQVDLQAELLVAVQLAGEWSAVLPSIKAEPWAAAVCVAVHAVELAQALNPQPLPPG